MVGEAGVIELFYYESKFKIIVFWGMGCPGELG